MTLRAIKSKGKLGIDIIEDMSYKVEGFYIHMYDHEKIIHSHDEHDEDEDDIAIETIEEILEVVEENKIPTLEMGHDLAGIHIMFDDFIVYECIGMEGRIKNTKDENEYDEKNQFLI